MALEGWIGGGMDGWDGGMDRWRDGWRCGSKDRSMDGFIPCWVHSMYLMGVHVFISIKRTAECLPGQFGAWK